MGGQGLVACRVTAFATATRVKHKHEEEVMPRKWILAAIGGGETTGPEVEAFGRLAAHVGAIIMTGGVPKQNSSAVTERAQFGCEAAGGLMISILPNKDSNEIVRCPGKRRFKVRTTNGKFTRDPITGAAADVIFVFPGEVGTLVELAYASREKRPFVFCGTQAQWTEMNNDRNKNSSAIRDGIEIAVREYGPDHKRGDLTSAQVVEAVTQLEYELDQTLQKPGSIGHFQRFLQVCSAPAPANTHFRGLPDCSGIKDFQILVYQLSAFGLSNTSRSKSASTVSPAARQAPSGEASTDAAAISIAAIAAAAPAGIAEATRATTTAVATAIPTLMTSS